MVIDHRLQIFQLAALRGNFTQAAAALGMTQPNVSGQIRQLERELGVKLFQREGRTVVLTPAGETLLAATGELLAQAENTVRLVRNAARQPRLLRLGATMTAGNYVLPQLAARRMQRRSNLRFTLQVGNTEEISDRLRKRWLDLALVEGPFDSRYFLARPLLRDELLVAGAPSQPLLRRGTPVALAELLRGPAPLLLRESGSGTRFHFDEFVRRLAPGVTGAERLELNSPEAIKGMLRTGFGLTVISELAIRDELAAGTLAAVRFKEGPLLREMNFIYLPEGPLDSCEEFIAGCCAAINNRGANELRIGNGGTGSPPATAGNRR